MTTIPNNKIRREDVLDTDFVDAIELSSDGYLLYRTSVLLTTTLSTSTVVIDPSSSLDLLDFGDYIVQSLDRILIGGTPEADGYYIINQILDSSSFTVFGVLPDSTDGYINFYYPAGASKVGIDNTNLNFTNKKTVQGALEDLAQIINPTNLVPNDIGQILYADDSENLLFNVRKPVSVDPGYFIIDDDGNLIVV